MGRSNVRKWRAAVAIGAIVGFAGCIERKMTIDSNPPGALVYLNDQEIGRTPVTKEFTWYGNYDVQIRKEGFEPLQTAQQVNAPVFEWVPIDLFAELLPLKFKDDQHFSFKLTPASTQPADADQMLEHGEQLKGMLESSPYTREPVTKSTTIKAATTKPATTKATGE